MGVSRSDIVGNENLKALFIKDLNKNVSKEEIGAFNQVDSLIKVFIKSYL
jgi:hypothetical protein